jgi:hypothetical protein
MDKPQAGMSGVSFFAAEVYLKWCNLRNSDSDSDAYKEDTNGNNSAGILLGAEEDNCH